VTSRIRLASTAHRGTVHGVSNPLLTPAKFTRAAERTPDQAGWAAADGAGRRGSATGFPPPSLAGGRTQETMTVRGAASATLLLTSLLLTASLFGWFATPVTGEAATLPGWTLPAALAGFVLALVVSFRATLARFLAPVYAVLEGVFLGAISRAYDTAYDGIVLQAVGATLGVFVVMLFLHTSRVLRVTTRMRRVVVGMTFGVMLFYLASLVASLFGAGLSFLSSPSPLGIGLSLFVAGLAAVNLSLDFDLIERGAAEGFPRHMEWYAGFGLLVTLVWLYLELLRLLAKLRNR
jgi:uncharacterized YccA/Bax inhibitor family protein